MSDEFASIYTIPICQPDSKCSQELPSPVPELQAPIHSIPLPARADNFVFLGYPLSRIKITARHVHFALCTGPGIYRLTIPDDVECPPSITPSFIFSDNPVGGACVGFSKTLVYRNDCSGSAISYLLLGTDDKLQSSIKPRLLTKKNKKSTAGYFMDEATGRVVQLVQGGRVSVMDFGLYHRRR